MRGNSRLYHESDGRLRGMRAKNTFAYPLQLALQKYIKQNDGLLPGAVTDLKPYLHRKNERREARFCPA